ncbi:alpha/beta hydrolase [Anaerobacillus sp. HL2]|nr:alpha/beta hydrolase [Anaerobacillus sp. HL2]
MKLMAFTLASAHTRSKIFQLEIKRLRKKTNPEVLRNMYNEGLHYKATDRLHKLNVPLMLIYGGKDHYVHHYQKIFQKKVKTDVDIVYISGSQTPNTNKK